VPDNSEEQAIETAADCLTAFLVLHFLPQPTLTNSTQSNQQTHGAEPSGPHSKCVLVCVCVFVCTFMGMHLVVGGGGMGYSPPHTCTHTYIHTYTHTQHTNVHAHTHNTNSHSWPRRPETAASMAALGVLQRGVHWTVNALTPYAAATGMGDLRGAWIRAVGKEGALVWAVLCCVRVCVCVCVFVCLYVCVCGVCVCMCVCMYVWCVCVCVCVFVCVCVCVVCVYVYVCECERPLVVTSMGDEGRVEPCGG